VTRSVPLSTNRSLSLWHPPYRRPGPHPRRCSGSSTSPCLPHGETRCPRSVVERNTATKRIYNRIPLAQPHPSCFPIAIDGNPVHTIEDVQNAIATLRQTTCHTARFTFTHDEIRTNLTAAGVPQLYFDQLNHIRHHLEDIRSPKAHKLTRRTLAGAVDWPEWEASEYKQLNQFAQQGMFAYPIPTPPNASIFNWVWTYNVKTDEATPKCSPSYRNGCIGGSPKPTTT
jgi:hypothetical protein